MLQRFRTSPAGLLGRAQACQKHVLGLERLAVSGAGSPHDPASDPGLPDVLRGLFGAQRPGDVASVADLMIRCHERDLALSLELALDLAVQILLVGFHRQQEVCSLLLELPNNGCWVCRASAWLSTHSRSSSLSSSRSSARS